MVEETQVGAWVKQRRLAAGWSQRVLAGAVQRSLQALPTSTPGESCSERTIRNLEAGRHPSLRIATGIVRAFGVPTDVQEGYVLWLLGHAPCPHARPVGVLARGHPTPAGDQQRLSACPEPTSLASRGALPGHRASPAVGAGTTCQAPVPFLLVGREAERAVLHHHLHALIQGQGGSIVLEGPAGIGKSCLIAELLAHAAAHAVPSFLGIASPLGHHLPFHAWGPVFTRLCTVPEPTPTERRDGGRRLHLGDADDELTDVWPLLNAVLPLNLPDTELTVQMTGRRREENTVRLLVRLLQRHARRTPLLIALEDAHWLDPASWALAQSVCARVARVLLVMATRSPLPASAAGHPTPVPAATTVHLPVGPLAAHDIDRLGCQCLGVAQVAEAVAAFLAERGQGHPFVTAELAASLRDAGLIAVVDEVAQFAAGVADEGGLPDCTLVHRAIGQRSAQLSTAHQVALHIASDWGAAYAMPILQPMHGLPLEPGRWSALGELASADAYREAA